MSKLTYCHICDRQKKQAEKYHTIDRIMRAGESWCIAKDVEICPSCWERRQKGERAADGRATMKNSVWTPEKLGRYMAEIGCIYPPPCHVCMLDSACTAGQTYAVCGDFSKLLDGLNKEEE